MRKTTASLLLACVVATLMPATASATRVRRLSLEQIRDRAVRVALLRVDEVSTRADEAGVMVWTDYRVTVLETLKGEGPDGLTLSFAGGTAGGLDTGIIGVPQLAAGETVLAFLSDNEKTAMPTVGWGQGLFRIVRGAGGEAMLISADGELLEVDSKGELVRGQRMQVTDGVATAAISRDRSRALRAPAPQVRDAAGNTVEFPRTPAPVSAMSGARNASLTDARNFVRGGER